MDSSSTEHEVCRGKHHYGSPGTARAHVGCLFFGNERSEEVQPTEHEQWERGRGRAGHHLYVEGRWVGSFARPEDAARAVAAVNAEAGLRAEVQRLTEKVSELVQVAHDLCAERDAARAELAAATTDGLPKPYESVREVAGVLRIGHGVESCWANPNDNPNWHRYHAANALALANEIERRARLADETTPEAGDHG